MESGLRVHHQESFPLPQRIASVWQCADHRRTGTSCVGMSKLYNYVEQQGGKDAALWKAIILSAPSATFADEVHKKRLFDSMFWISSVSLASCVISKNFLVMIMWPIVS